MSVNSRRAAFFLATASLCLTALSTPSLAGGHGGGSGGHMGGEAGQMSGHTPMGAGPDHSSNNATANNAATAMPAQNPPKTVAAQPAAGKKITAQRLIQADRAVHMRNMN